MESQRRLTVVILKLLRAMLNYSRRQLNTLVQLAHLNFRYRELPNIYNLGNAVIHKNLKFIFLILLWITEFRVLERAGVTRKPREGLGFIREAESIGKAYQQELIEKVNKGIWFFI